MQKINMDNMLDASMIEVFYDERMQIGLRDKKNGTVYTGLKVTLLFPLTDPDSFIKLSDLEDNEIGILRSLDGLDPRSRDIVQSEINKSYFVPAIEKIISIDNQFGADVWKVETDKGPRTFEVVGKRNIRYITADHVVIRDLDGNRYEIKSVSKLDPASRKLLIREA